MLSYSQLATSPTIDDENPYTLRDLFETYGNDIATLVPQFSLSEYQLVKIPPLLLRCHGLKELDLSHNLLQTLPSEKIVPALPKLEILRLNDNEFHTLEDMQGTKLGELKHLKELDISRNPIPAIDSRIVILGQLLLDGPPLRHSDFTATHKVQGAQQATSKSSPKEAGSRSRPKQGSETVPKIQAARRRKAAQATGSQDSFKDPKILFSLKTNLVGGASQEGPHAVSEHLSEVMQRPVHYCDMNVAPTPRAGLFPMLCMFNGVPVSVEDLDLARAEIKWDEWYRKYPRIQCQKRMEAGQSNSDAAVLKKQQDRHDKQVEAEMRRFQARMQGKVKREKVMQKKASKTASLSKRIAAKRSAQRLEKEKRLLRAEERKVEAHVRGLLREGRLDGGYVPEVDVEWVRVPNPQLEKGTDMGECTDQEATELLKALKLAATKRGGVFSPSEELSKTMGITVRSEGHTTPAATSQLAPDGTESDSERADSDAESELDEDILYREGEMSVFDEAMKELVKTKKLVELGGADPALSTGLPVCSLSYKEYYSLLADDNEEEGDEMRVSVAAAKRVESLKASLAKKREWKKPEASFHELIRKSYVKQKSMNDSLEEEIEKNAQVDIRLHQPSWEIHLAENTSKALDTSLQQFNLKTNAQFQVKALKPGWINNQLFLSASRSPRIRKEAPVDARTIEEHRKHRQRLSAINGGDIPPERTIPVPMYADGTPVTKESNSSPKARSSSAMSMYDICSTSGHKSLSSFERIVAPQPGEVTPRESILLENSRKIRKSFVEDIRSLKFKGENFKRDASHFVTKNQDPMSLMRSYYEQRETSEIEHQNVMIDGERFDYSPAFRKATEEATGVKMELKRIYMASN